MDQIRETIMARASELGLTAYGVSVLCVGEFGDTEAVSEDAVKRYFNDETSLKSKFVSQLCEVLSLKLTATKRTKVDKMWDEFNVSHSKKAKKKAKKKTKTVG
jgi:hypothetical protein